MLTRDRPTGDFSIVATAEGLPSGYARRRVAVADGGQWISLQSGGSTNLAHLDAGGQLLSSRQLDFDHLDMDATPDGGVRLHAVDGAQLVR